MNQKARVKQCNNCLTQAFLMRMVYGIASIALI